MIYNLGLFQKEWILNLEAVKPSLEFTVFICGHPVRPQNGLPASDQWATLGVFPVI